jgi:hypothetical protein
MQNAVSGSSAKYVARRPEKLQEWKIGDIWHYVRCLEMATPHHVDWIPACARYCPE